MTNDPLTVKCCEKCKDNHSESLADKEVFLYCTCHAKKVDKATCTYGDCENIHDFCLGEVLNRFERKDPFIFLSCKCCGGSIEGHYNGKEIREFFIAELKNLLLSQRTRICEELSSMKKDSGNYDDGLNRVEAVIEAKKEGFNSALDDAINRIKGL